MDNNVKSKGGGEGLLSRVRTEDGKVLIENPLKVRKNGQETHDLLVISKDGVEVQDRKIAFPASADDIASTTDALAVIGIIELCFAKYLLVATQKTLASTIQSHKIWKVLAGKAIAIGSTADQQQLVQKKETDETTLARYTLDQELLSHVKSIINSQHLYFSTTYDITHSIQHNALRTSSLRAANSVVDDRYFFNLHVQSPILAKSTGTGDVGDASPWSTSAIDIKIAGSSVGEGEVASDKTYTVALISRLNHRRLGTRYVRRGLDMDGNAANNVEMEQIVFHHDFSSDRGISAYVQMRGSAPAVWGQELNLDYRPELLIADISKADIWHSIEKHYSDLKAQYIGESSGFEKQLTKTYEETVRRFGDKKIHYEEFPVNKWCKKMNFRNMDILVDRMRDRLINSGLPRRRSLRLHRLQTGIARVSCLDSLDRTNLTCSIFARYMIPFQIASLADPAASAKFAPVDGASPNDVRDPVAGLRTALEPSVRILTNLWADSGDAVSLLYAGTRALKSDVTRTGKRQWLRGSLDDGVNSLTRYYLNNFSDVSADTMRVLAETDGAKKAKQLKKPFLEKGKGITGFFIPGSSLTVLSLYSKPPAISLKALLRIKLRRLNSFQEASYQHLGNGSSSTPKAGEQPSYISFLVSAIKIYAPEQVTGVLEFVVAMVVFFYILVLVKIFQLKGQSIVDRPKLSYEYATIHEVLD
ncbi:SacI homology domain-containing protein [Chytridium lagenaria]|nr:SacI homology domain-containing protein [Chytridium lagenaria]